MTTRRFSSIHRRARSAGLVAAAVPLAASLVYAQFTVTSPNIVNVNGTANPSAEVPAGPYMWPRSGTATATVGFEGAAPGAGQPPVANFNSIPLIDPAFAREGLADSTAPPEFEVRPWGTPPIVNHPTAVAATPDGTLFVAIDGNGTLTGYPHLGRNRTAA